MRRCLACHTKKPDDEFPSLISLTCKFCTPAYKANLFDIRGDQQTHSIGIRPHPHGNAIAKSLLQRADDFKTHAGPLAPPLEGDDRPLIDKLHEATFDDPVGLQWIKDKYGLRTILRKAHCFTLDDATSEMVADFSVAISKDLESARRLAIPPFPITWIDLNNQKRLKRTRELGIRLTPTAAGETEAGPPVERTGWLIQPADIGGYYASHICAPEQGIMMAPLSYWWHAGSANDNPIKDFEDQDHFMQALTFGVKWSNVDPTDAYPSVTPLHIDLLKPKGYSKQVSDLMIEIAGELRHIWGFLIALGAGQLGLEARITPQSPHNIIRKMPNGKPLLPLEHKILHLHLAKRMTPEKLVTRAISHHKNREHDVRGHWRTLRNEDGSIRKRIPIPDHKRGDKLLGVIEKLYVVKR